MVGRPREFDVDEALKAAMEAFWARGYEATSLNDLMAATGLHKGSIYKAFGDKHTLFVTALKRYLEEMRNSKTEILAQAESPLAGLRALAHNMVDLVDDGPCPKGCMAVNALVELAPHDKEVNAIMSDHVERMRSAIEETVSAGQKIGEISRTRPASLIAAMMMTFVAGLGTTMKGPITKTQAHALVDAQIEALL